MRRIGFAAIGAPRGEPHCARGEHIPAMKALSIALTFAFFSAVAAPASAGALLEVDGRLLKWVSEAPASTTIITYAVLNGPYALPGGRRILSPDNCSSMHAFNDIVAASPGVPAEAAEPRTARRLRGMGGRRQRQICRGQRSVFKPTSSSARRISLWAGPSPI